MNSKDREIKNFQRLIRNMRKKNNEKVTIQRIDNNIFSGKKRKEDKSGR